MVCYTPLVEKCAPELVGAFCFLGREESPSIQTTECG